MALGLHFFRTNYTVVPVEKKTAVAYELFNSAKEEDWAKALTTLDKMISAWNTHKRGNVPSMLEAQMSDALVELTGAVDARQVDELRKAALTVAKANFDFALQYRQVTAVDRDLFAIWTDQLMLDADLEDKAGVKGDVVVLERGWERISHTFEGDEKENIASLVEKLRTATDDEDLEDVKNSASKLQIVLEK